MKRIKEIIDLSVIANKIKEQPGIKKYNRIVCEGKDLLDILHVLKTYLNQNIYNQIPEVDKFFLVVNAYFNVCTDQNITKDKIEKSLRLNANSYFTRKLKKYILCSSLSMNYSNILTDIDIDHNKLIFSDSFPKQFDFSPLKDNFKKYVPFLFFNDGLKIRVVVKARSEYEAAEKALTSLDFLRGILNFLLIESNSSFFFIEKIEPINCITIGPASTLHFQNGKLASDQIWYEPQYYHVNKKIYKIDNLIELKENENKIRENLNKHNYGEFLKSIFVNYTRAFDSVDFESSFLKLWCILEKLTNTTDISYDNTIKRAIFLFDDRNFHKQILEHLRTLRNIIVHHNKSNFEMIVYVYQLKRYVDKLIHFHIENKFDFKSIGKACEFLDLPFDVDILKEKIDTYEKAYNLLK